MKALILDLNGVLITSPRLSDRFTSAYGVSFEEFLPALKEVMEKVRMPGAPSVYSSFEPYFKKWNVSITEQEFEDFWFHAETENKEMTGFARDLKRKGVRLFVLSNNLRERTIYYNARFPFLPELFEKTYYSWQTGFVKPDPRTYELILKENELRPEECVYFDDSKENVEVGRALGIESFVFTNVEEAKVLLDKRKPPLPAVN
jgi:glucose-1-phosphatase